jgi:hypothetical protein
VLETILLAGEQPLAARVRIAQAPFVLGIDVTSLESGREYWFVTDEAGPFQVLRTFVPVR